MTTSEVILLILGIIIITIVFFYTYYNWATITNSNLEKMWIIITLGAGIMILLAGLSVF